MSKNIIFKYVEKYFEIFQKNIYKYFKKISNKYFKKM